MHYLARQSALFFSYIFHPIWLPSWTAFLLTGWYTSFLQPLNTNLVPIFLGFIFITHTLIPLILLYIVRLLGFIKSIRHPNGTDRFIGLAMMSLYFTALYFALMLYQITLPVVWLNFLKITLWSVTLAALLNRWVWVSLHVLALANTTVFLFLNHFNWMSDKDIHSISLGILLTGTVASARLQLQEHTMYEIVGALAVAILSNAVLFYQ